MWKLHRKLNFPNILRLAAIYTWAPAFKDDNKTEPNIIQNLVSLYVLSLKYSSGTMV